MSRFLWCYSFVLRSFLIDILCLAKDAQGKSLRFADLVSPAIFEYDAVGLPLEDWQRLYDIPLDSPLVIREFSGLPFLEEWTVYVEDRGGQRYALPAHLLLGPTEEVPYQLIEYQDPSGDGLALF